MTDELKVGGDAFEEMLKHVDVDAQIKSIKENVPTTTSVSKRDVLIKKLKYLSGLKKVDLKPEDAYILHNLPVLPPTSRPVMIQSGNRIEFSDVNQLYRDHMLVNNSLKDIRDMLPPEELISERRDLYAGAKAISGLGEAISGASRGRNLKGILQQVAGTTGPKTGYFHSKLLSKKQDFSGRGTIYSEPNLGFNEMAMPKDSLWTMYKFHIIRDLVKKGYHYVDAEKAWEAKNPSATDSFNKMIKQVPVIVNRAPTLMRSNISAFHPVPTEGTGLGVNPLHLPLFAGDYDGDAVSMFLPMTPEAIKEAKENMLPQHQMYDYRKGVGQTLIAPGHEAIIGSVHMTEPDMKQKVQTFESEEAVLKALKEGIIQDNTPIKIVKVS
jgi:DNA-directed RNA polymerase subunit beta'